MKMRPLTTTNLCLSFCILYLATLVWITRSSSSGVGTSIVGSENVVDETSAGSNEEPTDPNDHHHYPLSNRNLDQDCPSYGCVILPQDIMLDTDVRDALHILRSVEYETTIHSENSDQTISSEQAIVSALEVLKPSGDDDKVTLTLRGNKDDRTATGSRDPQNQDRAVIISPYRIIRRPHQGRQFNLETTNEDENEDGDTFIQLLGVFDGHGELGEITAQYASTEIPRLLVEKLANIDWWNDTKAVSDAIEATFVEVDQTEPTHGAGGTTASMVLQIGPKIYVANAGDSRSIIAVLVEEEVQVVYASREDKPDLPQERQRIMAMGGYVHVPPNDEGDVPRAFRIDENGNALHGLAMSRSIGDDVQGVIPNPIVDVLDVSEIVSDAITYHAQSCAEDESEEEEEKKEQDEKTCAALDPRDVRLLALSATDGMLDFLELDDIAYLFAASFFVEDNPLPHTAAEYAILRAAEAWDEAYEGEYRDDISVAAFKLHSGDSIRAEADYHKQ